MLREKLAGFKLVDGLLILGIVLVIAGIGMNFKDNFWEKTEVVLQSKTETKNIGSTGENDVQVANKVTIDVGGEVIKAGVYQLDEGSRINDALVAARGLGVNADRDWVDRNLNKAEKLVDGQKIYIPKVGEKAEIKDVLGDSVTETKIVRINTATVEQLDTLSGIGPSIAQKIIDYRSENGGFKNIEELKLVSGIGDKLFEKIKEDIAL